MRWNHIKTVTILLLLVVNIWLICLLAGRQLEQSYLDADALQNTVEIMAENQIELSVDQLDQARGDADLYAAVQQEDYYEAVTAVFTDSPIANLFPTPVGTRILTEEGDSLSFGSDNAVSFLRAGGNRDEMLSLAARIPLEGDVLAPASFKLRDLRRQMEDLLNSRIDGGNVAAANARLTFDEIYRMGEFYLLRCSQNIDDLAVLDHRVECICAADGELLFLDGRWSFLSLVRNYSAPLYDQINILFIEKDAVEELRADGEAAETLTLDSLSLCYVLTNAADADSGDTTVYFSPAWRIVYTDGSSRVYHAVTGQPIGK